MCVRVRLCVCFLYAIVAFSVGLAREKIDSIVEFGVVLRWNGLFSLEGLVRLRSSAAEEVVPERLAYASWFCT